MKKIIFVLFSLVPFILFAQTKPSNGYTVSTGIPYAEVSGRDHEYFSDDLGKCILVKSYYQTVVLQHYDVNGMKEISRHEYIDFPKGLKNEKCLKTGNRLFYLYSIPNKSKTRSLYAREINTTTGTFMEPKLLFETQGSVEFIYANADGIADLYDISTHFEVKKSFDQSKILIHYKREPTTKNNDSNYEVIGLYVFDMNLTPLWGSEKKMPYTEKKQNIKSYTIGKNGTAYILALTNDGTNLQYEFFYTSQDTSIQKTKLDIDTQILFQDIKITENNEGNINCTGYFNSGMDRKFVFQDTDLLDILFFNEHTTSRPGINTYITQSVQGIFRIKLSSQGIMLEKNTHEFPIDFINKYESPIPVKQNNKKEEKNKPGIKDLLLFDIIENSDGSTLIIGEQKYMRIEHTIKDLPPNSNAPSLNGRTTDETKKLYYTKNIVVTKLNSSGQIAWETKLPKFQLSYIGMGSIGFKYVEVNNSSYFLFLDAYDKTSGPDNEEPFLYKVSDGGQLHAFKIDNTTGTYTIQPILDTEDGNGNVINKLPTVRIFNAGKKILLFEYDIKGKLDNMIKIKIN